jgi:hypothetical protein
MDTKFTIELEPDEHEKFLNTHHSNFPIGYKHNFMSGMPPGFLMLSKISIKHTEIKSEEQLNITELLKSTIVIENIRYNTGLSFSTIFYGCLLRNKKCKLINNKLILKPKNVCVNHALMIVNNRDGLSFDYEPVPCESITIHLPMTLSIKMTFIITETFDKTNSSLLSALIPVKVGTTPVKVGTTPVKVGTTPVKVGTTPLRPSLDQFISPLFITFSYFDDEKTKVNNVTYTINNKCHCECHEIIQKKFGNYVVCIAPVLTEHLVDDIDIIDISSMDDIQKFTKSIHQILIKPCILSDPCVDVTPSDTIEYINVLSRRELLQ